MRTSVEPFLLRCNKGARNPQIARIEGMHNLAAYARNRCGKQKVDDGLHDQLDA
jgi:hypothetical protein